MENDFDKCISELYSMRNSSDIYEIHNLLQEVLSESSNLENVLEIYKTDAHLKFMRDAIKDRIRLQKEGVSEFKFGLLEDKEEVKEEVKQEVRQQEQKQDPYKELPHLDTDLPHSKKGGFMKSEIVKTVLLVILLTL
jgi:hypothetical protein